MRQIEGVDVEVARGDGTVWGRVGINSGWRSMGAVSREGAEWVGRTFTLSAWQMRDGKLEFVEVQRTATHSFRRQYEAVRFIVQEYLAAGPHS